MLCPTYEADDELLICFVCRTQHDPGTTRSVLLRNVLYVLTLKNRLHFFRIL